MVQSFQGHAAGQRPVADHGHDVEFLVPAVAGDGQARGEAERRGSVPGVQDVVLALGAVGETEQAALFADGKYPFPAAGDDLVGIALVADVPDDLVQRRVEDPMQGQGQVHGPQVGRQVPAVLRDHLHQQFPDLLRQGGQFLQAQFLDVGRGMDRFQQRHYWLR